MSKYSWTRDFTRILKIFLVIVIFSCMLKTANASLFDSLPLNGALVSSDSDGEVLQDLTPTNFTEVTKPSLTSLKSGEKSLFDMLPHQGAIVPSKLNTSKPTGVTYSVTNSRNQRQSTASKTSKRSFNDFEIERQPTTDLDISFFNSHLLPSVVQTLTQPELPRSQTFPILSQVNRQSGGYGPPKQNNRPQIVPEPVVFREVKLANAVRNSQSSYAAPQPTGASATSGGSTVIVYANPPPERASAGETYKSQGYVTAPPPRTSYGVPTERSTSPAPKNEVHYHYHITNNNRIESTTAPSTEYGPPSKEYGAPRTTSAAPPPSYGPPFSSKPKKVSYSRGGYGESTYSNRGGYEESRNTNRGSYEAPSESNRGGYQESSNSNRGGYQVSSNSNRGGYQDSSNSNRGSYQGPNESTRGGYDDSSYAQRTPSTTPAIRELVVPVITGVSLTGSRNPGGYQDQTSQSSSVSEFTSRKLYTSLQAPSDPNSYQYSNNPVPAPSASYGQPPTYTDSYTTTTTSPPPQEPFSNPPQHLAQTSITLETIPITTTETRFVTVPKIVQTLGTTLQQPPEQLNNPPAISPQYGPPSTQQNIRLSPSQQENARNILDEHLAQLSPQRLSQGSASDVSDLDLLALLQQSSRGNQFASILNPQQQSDIRGFTSINSNSNSPAPTFTDLRQTPQSISFNALPLIRTHSQPSGGTNNGFDSVRGSNAGLGPDGVGTLTDLIREQRLQLALTDLRGRLRQQTRNNDRNRQNLRDLFFKGALLMAGLTLIPSAATIRSSPDPQITTSSLVPLTAGRRRRSLSPQEFFVEIPKPLESIPNRTPLAHPTQFPKSLDQLNAVHPITLQFSAAAAIDPEGVSNTTANSPLACMQRQFCETLQSMEKNKQNSMVFLYAALSPDLDKNKFLRDAVRAAGQDDCAAFLCDKILPTHAMR